MRIQRGPFWLLSGSLLGALCIGGWAGCGSSRMAGTRRAVTARDFGGAQEVAPQGIRVGEPAAASVPPLGGEVAAVPPDVPQTSAQGAGEALDVNNLNGAGRAARTTGPIAASEGITDASGSAGAPELVEGNPESVGSKVLVDAKIGDINGKPIYASTFFDVGTPTQEPLGPRLEAESRVRSARDWAVYAQQEINQRLDLFIQDELLRAEAISTLSPNEKQGLFAFVERLQQDRQREAGGSREALKKELEGQGVTVEEWTRRREQTELVRYQINQKILRRINVSWRDIEQAYNGRFRDVYRHPPRYRYYLVMVPSSATADREAVEKAVAEKRPFEEIAGGTLNRYRNDKGGLEVREVNGDIAEASLFPNPALNAAARALKEGETSPPVPVGDSVAWVHLADVDYAPTLYNAQLDIEDRLHRQRVNDALNQYLLRLQGHGNMSSVPEMRARLLEIAAERYSPGPKS